MSPESSDIRFRKHLKKDHPSKKTLLKYSNKTKEYDASIFSILNDKENQALALGLSVHNAKVNKDKLFRNIKLAILYAGCWWVTYYCDIRESLGQPIQRGDTWPWWRMRQTFLTCKIKVYQWDPWTRLREASKKYATKEIPNQSFLFRLSSDAEMCPICCDSIEEGELNSGCDIVKLFQSQELTSVVSSLSELVQGMNWYSKFVY